MTTSSSLIELATTVAHLSDSIDEVAEMDAENLRSAVATIAELRRETDILFARVAAEIAHRSRRELGYQGMAQHAGFVSATRMLQSDGQLSRQDASRLIEVGTMLAQVEASRRSVEGREPSAEPQGEAAAEEPSSGVATAQATAQWQHLLSEGLEAGTLSVDKVGAIRRVMGDIAPTNRSGPDDATMTTAVRALISGAVGQSPEQVVRAAKVARDLIDADGIARREQRQHDLRSVRTWRDPITGMHHGSWRLAPEDGLLITDAIATILSPRRGGPRFVEKQAAAAAEELVHDERTDDQIAADAFTAMLRLAIDADRGAVFGARRPAVRVVVTADRLVTRDGQLADQEGIERQLARGHAHLEGTWDAVSRETVERHICDTGVMGVAFDDDGQCVNVGRDQRLFTKRQRVGLAVRDGGCRFPSCDREPSFTEAHHINPWKAKHGRTDIADGVLLCRHHHMLIHNNDWSVSRDGGRYLLTPPPEVDPDRTPIAMHSRNPSIQALHVQHA